ncbi:50S ribosomal protein L6 [Candidatus Roizmanbacteria bacterium RIFCSPLOWO2_01_FULL_38_12]|uniref:50S ribosomal protein L6 n=1 Tax=Candidatus Roizmanbacteria bacterium RIFCSPLOWO2_01_FULL_38_12 TaxID=1802061 RepID=A0A1F7IY20_9BACT|nr:MAG: 50S ribosomal protein L6 [Candidatus Roizmanbacteria bacterium RIFCSPHIGHO2_01_FULL_38_15]OGK35891.1 MAG: 50S ribosomal protein L6 [Candidatus Roizmanbacteria bacterium RIFCSPHIGHO2_12_FULL_38_13]OGK48244.1 MAG: 50S ribosomal protein L6 [Candidatus Roizmanbacteria bacterium RIFCSPLOWO2_01_FULL_38_12]
MSKIGQKAIPLPTSIQVDIQGKMVTVKGLKDSMSFTLPKFLSIEKKDDTLVVKRDKDSSYQKASHGLYRSLIANAARGIEKPWTRRLEIVGTGFNVKMQGTGVVLRLGFSHPVQFKPPAGIQLATEENNIIIVSGADRQLVGQVAYQIKSIKKPDPYKGKGIRYQGEHIRLKPGKKVKTEA